MNMKRIGYISAVFAIASVLVSCSGNAGEEDNSLFLEADRTTLAADGTETAVFTVYSGNTDVTADAQISCTTDGTVLESAGFATSAPGTYSFVATYDGMTSNPVSIVAKSAGGTEVPAEPSKFVRELCIMYFTYQTCSFCPDGYRYLAMVVENSFSDIAHVLALHSSQGGDVMAIPVQDEISDDLQVQGYPSASVDMRTAFSLSNDKTSLRPQINSSLEDYPAHCGVAVSSVYDEQTGKAEVTAKLYSELTSSYRIAVYVVENDIVGKQTDGQITYDNYIHHYVARELLSASYKGDSLGSVEKDTEALKTYSLTVDPEWNLDNTMIYVLAIDDAGLVNNVAVCPLVGGNTGYNYVADAETID